MDKVKQAVKDSGAAEAISDMPADKKRYYDKPVVSVGMNKAEGGPSGMYGYLGEMYDETRGESREIYGRKLDVELSLDIRSPAGGGDECTAVFSKLVTALDRLGSGIRIRECACGDVSYDRNLDMYCMRGSVSFTAFIYAEKEESGDRFTDFTLKGEIIG